MSTLKSYHIHHLQAQINKIQKQYRSLRDLIELGDMQAVEELSGLRKNIVSQQTRISNYQQKFENTEIEVFLFGLSSVLNTLLDNYQTKCTIKEERTALPWKKQAFSYNNKLNCSKKTSASQMFNTTRTKSHSQSKSRLTKSVSEKSIDSRLTTGSINQETRQKQSVQLKNNPLQQLIQKSTQSQKDTIYHKQKKVVTERKKTDYKSKKPSVQNHDSMEKLVTIKIGPQEFEEIIKLKNALFSQISFGS